MVYAVAVVARFWSKVRVVKKRRCWEWAGARDRYGYGEFKPKSGAPKRAHRIAYELWHDVRLSSDTMILHACDNPSCCNPRHLFEGDTKANHDDREDGNGRFISP